MLINDLPEEVIEITRLLREEDSGFWPRLRILLREKGVDPATAWLIECFPDDNSFEYGIIVTADCHTFQFGYDYLHKPIKGGSFTDWNDRTARLPHLAASKATGQVMTAMGCGQNDQPKRIK